MKSIRIALALAFTVGQIPLAPQLSSVASAQWQGGANIQGSANLWGNGYWGANQVCPYPVSPNPGGYDKKDALDMMKDKLKSKKALLKTKQKRADQIDGRISDLEDKLTGFIGAAWWLQISTHISGGKECCFINSRETSGTSGTTAMTGAEGLLNGLKVAANPMMPAATVNFDGPVFAPSAERMPASFGVGGAVSAAYSAGNAQNSQVTGSAATTGAANKNIVATPSAADEILPVTSGQSGRYIAGGNNNTIPLGQTLYSNTKLDPACKALDDKSKSITYAGAKPVIRPGQTPWYKDAVNQVYSYYFDAQKQCRVQITSADGKELLTKATAITPPSVTNPNAFGQSIANQPAVKGQVGLADRCKYIWTMNRGGVYKPGAGKVSGNLSFGSEAPNVTNIINALVVSGSNTDSITYDGWKGYISKIKAAGYTRVDPNMTASQFRDVLRQDLAYYVGARCDIILSRTLEKTEINLTSTVGTLGKWIKGKSWFDNMKSLDTVLKYNNNAVPESSKGQVIIPTFVAKLATPGQPTTPTTPTAPGCNAETRVGCTPTPQTPAPQPPVVITPQPPAPTTPELPGTTTPELPGTTTTTQCEQPGGCNTGGATGGTTTPAKTCPSGAAPVDDSLKVDDWKAVCKAKGQIDINKICSSSTYSSAKGGEVGRCKAALSAYIKALSDSDKLQSSEIADLEQEIAELEDLISEIAYRKSVGESYDDLIEEMEGECTDCVAQGDATPQQKGIDWGNVITGVAPALANMVVGIYGNYKYNQTIQQNQNQFYNQQKDARDLATRLGYPYTVQPFPSTGNYGYPFGQGGIYGSAAGGLGAGGFGCAGGINGGGMMTGPYGMTSPYGINGGLYGQFGAGPFGSPYGMNMAGGGMYMPGASPYAMNGFNPWTGGAGFQIGGQFGAGTGYMPGAGGGQMGICIVGVTSACNGNMPGGGMIGGGAGFNGGAMGGMDAYFQYQQQMLQYQMQQQQAQQARMQSAQSLYQEMYQLQMRIQQLMYGYGTGDVYSAGGTVSGGATFGVGASGSFGGTFGTGASIPGSGAATSPGSTNIGAGQ